MPSIKDPSAAIDRRMGPMLVGATVHRTLKPPNMAMEPSRIQTLETEVTACRKPKRPKFSPELTADSPQCQNRDKTGRSVCCERVPKTRNADET